MSINRNTLKLFPLHGGSHCYLSSMMHSVLMPITFLDSVLALAVNHVTHYTSIHKLLPHMSGGVIRIRNATGKNQHGERGEPDPISHVY